ncbi:invasion associated locus B family protein [Thioclava sp. GXIMD2076]|uniref:Invasion associated locus B family protein n=1 Tax=Thioclava kandeliae TaxID=3070818 RepID=A0ABV1SJV7_9RHOB
MMNSVLRSTVAAAMTCAAMSLPAVAQETTNRVAAETDWSVFVEGNPKECWGVSAPKTTVNSKDGQPVQVRRGDILLFVTYRPGKQPEISFMGGYPFEGGSTVDMDVGGKKFTLFTDGEGAWAGSADEDKKIIAALKAGADVTLTGHSGRGTQTKDTFSLMGFTAAMGEAESRCK